MSRAILDEECGVARRLAAEADEHPFRVVRGKAVAIDADTAERLAVQYPRVLVGRKVALPDGHLTPPVVHRPDQAIDQVPVDLVFGDAVHDGPETPPAPPGLDVHLPTQFPAAVGFEEQPPAVRRDFDRRGTAVDLDRLPQLTADSDEEARPSSRIAKFKAAMFGGTTIPA